MPILDSNTINELAESQITNQLPKQSQFETTNQYQLSLLTQTIPDDLVSSENVFKYLCSRIWSRGNWDGSFFDIEHYRDVTERTVESIHGTPDIFGKVQNWSTENLNTILEGKVCRVTIGRYLGSKSFGQVLPSAFYDDLAQELESVTYDCSGNTTFWDQIKFIYDKKIKWADDFVHKRAITPQEKFCLNDITVTWEADDVGDITTTSTSRFKCTGYEDLIYTQELAGGVAEPSQPSGVFDPLTAYDDATFDAFADAWIKPVGVWPPPSAVESIGVAQYQAPQFLTKEIIDYSTFSYYTYLTPTERQALIDGMNPWDIESDTASESANASKTTIQCSCFDNNFPVIETARFIQGELIENQVLREFYKNRNAALTIQYPIVELSGGAVSNTYFADFDFDTTIFDAIQSVELEFIAPDNTSGKTLITPSNGEYYRTEIKSFA